MIRCKSGSRPPRRRPRREAIPQELLQLDVAGQFLGQQERFDDAVGAEPLAVGDQPHHVDAQQRERAGAPGFGPCGRDAAAGAEFRPQQARPRPQAMFFK